MGSTDRGVLGQIADDPAIMMQLIGKTLPGVTYNQPSLYGQGNQMTLRPGAILGTLGSVYGGVRDQRISDELMADIAKQQAEAERPLNKYKTPSQHADWSSGQPQVNAQGVLEERPIGERAEEALRPGPSMNVFLANLTPEKRRVFLEGMTTGGKSPVMAGWGTLQQAATESRGRNMQAVLHEAQERLAKDPNDLQAQSVVQRLLSEAGAMQYLGQRQHAAGVEKFIQGIESQDWARKIPRTGDPKIDLAMATEEYGRGQKIQAGNDLLKSLTDSGQYTKEELDIARPFLIAGRDDLAKPWLAKGPERIALNKFNEQFKETLARARGQFKPYTPEQLHEFSQSPYWSIVEPIIDKYQTQAYAHEEKVFRREEAERAAKERESLHRAQLAGLNLQREHMRLQVAREKDLKEYQFDQKVWQDQYNQMGKWEKIANELKENVRQHTKDGVVDPIYRAQITAAEDRVKQLSDSTEKLHVKSLLRRDPVQAAEYDRGRYRSAISEILARPVDPLKKQQALRELQQGFMQDPLYAQQSAAGGVTGVLPPDAREKVQRDIFKGMQDLDAEIRKGIIPPGARSAPSALPAMPPSPSGVPVFPQ